MSEFVEWIIKYGWRVVTKAFYIPADYFHSTPMVTSHNSF